MGGWRVAKSLDQLLAEINASAPNRNKASDGSIGDENHQGTNSDHNPWCQGWIVTARDFTHDPAGGFDSYEWAEWQRKRCRGDILINGQREIRVKYIISNRKIASPSSNWSWRTYTGTNPHDHHAHISVDCTAEGGYMDSVTPWGWTGGGGDMDSEQNRKLTNAETYAWKAAVGENPITGILGGNGQPVDPFTNVPDNQRKQMLAKLDELLTRPASVPPPADLAAQIAAALVADTAFLDAIALRVVNLHAERLGS